MIEIALSLGIIAFALVAIIGILPYSMGVQRENREGTIINQEASVLESAIRNGAQGMDDLTNYVVAITNTQTVFPAIGKPTTTVFGYTRSNSTSGLSPQSQQLMNPPFLLNNGFRIVGLLSTPKYWPIFVQSKQGQQFLGSYSNHVVATVRSMSGSASDKAPQLNASVLDMAFAYRVICEVVPYGSGVWSQDNPSASSAWDQDWTNYTYYLNSKTPADWLWRSNNWQYARNLQADLNDVRLLFRWPALPNGKLGNGRLLIRSATSGPLQPFLEPGFAAVPSQPQPYTLYFVQPNTFARAQ